MISNYRSLGEAAVDALFESTRNEREHVDLSCANGNSYTRQFSIAKAPDGRAHGV